MTFSKRTAWDLRPNPIALRLAHRPAPPAFDLTEGNPTRCGLGWDPAELRAALDVHGLERYEPDPQGMLSAREAVAGHHARRGNVVSPASLFLTSSTSEAYSWLFKLLCDPGDVVLVPHPGYPLFEYLAGLEGVTVEPYPMRFDGDWWLDLAALRTRIGPRTRAIVVVNPGNPTGAYLSQEEAHALGELCATHGTAIVSDEVFSDYAHAADTTRRSSLLGLESALTFVLSGLSKTVALPQMKLGWIHLAGPADAVAIARHRLEIIADTFLSPGASVQLAAPRLLDGAARIQARVLERVRGNLAALRAAVPAASPLSILPVEGGWYAVVRGPATRPEDETVLALLDDDVLVQPGYFFDFATPGHFVVSLLPEPAVFAEGARRLAARLAA